MFSRASLLQSVLATAFVLTPVSAVHAQHVHGGDMIVDVIGGKLTVTGAGESQFGTGYPIFEGDFSVPVAPHRWHTDDPGFDMESGTLVAGEALWFRGLGTLKTWNGSVWTAAVPDNEFIQFGDGIQSLFAIFRPSGVTVTNPGSSGFIDNAGGDGKIHQHRDFFLLNSTNDLATSGNPVTPGAYLIELQLFSPVLQNGVPKYLDSAPFLIAFNRGLSDEDFEFAVQALAVPEPSAALMLVPGLALIAWRLKNRRRTQA